MQQTAKIKRERSPSYPYMSLPEAVALLKAFHKEAKRSAIDKETATRLIGFSPKSSSGGRALSTLISFGILQNDPPNGGKYVKISDLGLDIIYPADDEKLNRALQKSALKPTLYNWALERWRDGLPGESVMKPVLIREARLSESAVQSFIKDLSKTFEYAKIYNAGTLAVAPETREDGNFDDIGELQPLDHLENKSEFRDYDFPLSEREVAKLRMPLPLTKKKLRAVLRYAQLMLETIEEDNERAGGNEI